MDPKTNIRAGFTSETGWGKNVVVHCTSKDPHIGALVLGDFAASARSPPQML